MGVKGHDRALVVAVDDGLGRTGFALEGDCFPVVVDSLQVCSGRDKDEIAVGSSINRLLDGGLIRRNAKRGRESGYSRKTEQSNQEGRTRQESYPSGNAFAGIKQIAELPGNFFWPSHEGDESKGRADPGYREVLPANKRPDRIHQELICSIAFCISSRLGSRMCVPTDH